jgi:hypothetical protein
MKISRGIKAIRVKFITQDISPRAYAYIGTSLEQ